MLVNRIVKKSKFSIVTLTLLTFLNNVRFPYYTQNQKIIFTEFTCYQRVETKAILSRNDTSRVVPIYFHVQKTERVANKSWACSWLIQIVAHGIWYRNIKQCVASRNVQYEYNKVGPKSKLHPTYVYIPCSTFFQILLFSSLKNFVGRSEPKSFY